MSTQTTRTFHWYDYITFNIYFLGLSTLSQTLSPLVFPLLVQQFVGEETKASFFGSLRLWSLMVALLAQAFWGILSDRTTLRFGRRRPYILGGTLVDLFFIAAISLSAGMSGATGYVFLFIVALLLQISSNAAQAAQQAIIPDLVPEEKRGRFSAFKSLFEVPLPLILVSFTIGKVIGSGNMVGGILIAVAVLLIAMIIAMFVREEPLKQVQPFDWQPFVRLILMTALFTIIILGLGEVTKFFGTLLAGISDVATLMIFYGGVGVIAMAIAVGLGVYLCVRISLGDAAKSTLGASFTWWVVNRLAFLVGAINISTFIVFFLQGRLGLVKETAAGPAANLLLVVGIMILIFALVSGWLSDRIGHKRTVAIAGVLGAIGVAIAIAVPNMTAINIGGLFIGAATGMFYTANWALGTKLVPQAEAGRYLGISNLAGAGAGAVGAYIGGPIADYFTMRFPDIPGIGYVLLFAIYGVLILLSVVALMRVQEPRKT
jgi:MFS family permease